MDAQAFRSPLAKFAFSECRIWPNQKPPFRMEANGRLNNTFQLWSGHRPPESVESAGFHRMISSSATS